MVPLFLLCIGLTALLTLTATAAAEEGDGTLRGVVTIVGQENLRDGEVVVSFNGTDDAAGTAMFDSDGPEYDLDLPPGDYDVYAWAPVFHNSDRVAFSIVPNETEWVNLTVVRIEEILGLVEDQGGEPVAGAVLQFTVDGTIVSTSHSDDTGKFRELIDPGTYNVVVTKGGFHQEEVNITVEPGMVMDLVIDLEPVPVEDEEDEFPTVAAGVIVFIILVLGGSIGYMRRQARRVRLARERALAERTRDLECPECTARVPEGVTICPECNYVFQVRCSECGRSMDAGTADCPECGNPMT
jgi:hypothetical protein